MLVELTGQTVSVLLNEEEIQTLYEGGSVFGSPTSAFPVGSKVLMVRQIEKEDLREKYEQEQEKG